MLILRNKNELDIRAISTFGYSVKERGAIGFFGTGLKYAISIMLREGVGMTLITGGKTYTFSSKTHQASRLVEGEAKVLELVCMNGEELGFTTQLGQTWQLWQGFRELYCNCLDEDGTLTAAPDGTALAAEVDETVIALTGPKIMDVYSHLSEYFRFGPPSYKTTSCWVTHHPARAIYYKGIRVKDDVKPSLLTYDIRGPLDLTEDRTAKYSYQVQAYCSRAVTELEDEALITRLLLAPAGTFEADLTYDLAYHPGGPFVNVCQRLVQQGIQGLNQWALQYVRKFTKAQQTFQPLQLTSLQQGQLTRAQALLSKAGYDIDFSVYPLHAVRELGQGILAEAKDGQIWLAEACFLQGTKVVAHALLEEAWHLQHGFKDETREFQTFLFRQVLSLVEQLNQEAF